MKISMALRTIYTFVHKPFIEGQWENNAWRHIYYLYSVHILMYCTS